MCRVLFLTIGNARFAIQISETVNKVLKQQNHGKNHKFIVALLRVVEWVALIRFLFGMCHY